MDTHFYLFIYTWTVENLYLKVNQITWDLPSAVLVCKW